MRKMKDSGVEWIGKIPEEWSVRKFKNKYTHKKEIAKEKSIQFERLALTLNGVVKRPKEDLDGLQPKEFDSYQILEKHDFVFKMIDLQNISTSRVGLSPYTGLVSPAYIRFSPRERGQCNQFVYYYLMSMYYNCVYNKLGGDGVRSALNATDIGEFKLPVPPLSEQERIAAYLDKRCGAIERLIANQEEQIEKLKSYKQSLITETVTRGLDPNVPMKDSGIEWIGKIPQHWEVRRVKYVSTYNDEVLPESYDSEADIEYVEIGSVTLEDGVKSFEILKFKNAPSRARRIARYGDIIISTVRTYLNAIALIDKEKYIVSTGFCVIRPNECINNCFYKYYCSSKIFTDFVSSYSVGISYPAINASTLVGFPVFAPPLSEQKRIAEYLDKRCGEIDKLVAIKEAKIERLREYKKSLIFEYVTGKREVV